MPGDRELWTIQQVAAFLGYHTKSADSSARKTLHRLGVGPKAIRASRGTGGHLYDAQEVRDAHSARLGQGARMDRILGKSAQEILAENRRKIERRREKLFYSTAPDDDTSGTSQQAAEVLRCERAVKEAQQRLSELRDRLDTEVLRKAKVDDLVLKLRDKADRAQRSVTTARSKGAEALEAAKVRRHEAGTALATAEEAAREQAKAVTRARTALRKGERAVENAMEAAEQARAAMKAA